MEASSVLPCSRRCTMYGSHMPVIVLRDVSTHACILLLGQTFWWHVSDMPSQVHGEPHAAARACHLYAAAQCPAKPRMLLRVYVSARCPAQPRMLVRVYISAQCLAQPRMLLQVWLRTCTSQQHMLYHTATHVGAVVHGAHRMMHGLMVLIA
eukprot:365846-Chlamydomonas_euryale.AAC.3